MIGPSRRTARATVLALVVATATIGLTIVPAAAATFTVDSMADAVDANPGDGVCATAEGACTLRAAVQEANALGGGHTIELPAGTYVLTEGVQLAITGDITVAGAGAESTVVAGNPEAIGAQLDRVFDVEVGASLTIDGITVRDGRSPFDQNGGGIRSAGTLTVLNSIVSSNHARRGAANQNGDGGGISATGPAVVRNSTVVNNRADDDGGGIKIDGGYTLEVLDSIVVGNESADKGGGIWVTRSSNVLLDRSVLRDNASDDGGGLALQSDSSGTIMATTIAGNIAGADGGGVEVNNRAVLTVRNSTLSGNTAQFGGAIDVEPGSELSLTNVTVVDNVTTAPTFGAISNWTVVLLVNTIIANSGESPNCTTHAVGATFTSSGGNLSSDDSCGLAADGDQSSTDPLLGALADNGGPTPTHLPLEDSPAIDAGDDDRCEATDQRGVARPQDGNDDGTARCDIGAVEVLGAVITEPEQEPGEEAPEPETEPDVEVEAPPATAVVATPRYTG